MNRKQLLSVLIAVAVFGTSGLLWRHKQNASWTQNSTTIGQKLLPDLPINDIAQLTIRHADEEVNLVRHDDGWRVSERNDYPADFGQIRELLVKVRDLKAVRTEPVGASQLPRLHLAANGPATNAPTIVEFKGQDGKVIRSLLLGKKHMKKGGQPSPFGDSGDEGFADGRYVKVGADSQNVATITDPFENIEPKAEQWLSKEFVRVERARSVEATFPVPTNSWKLTRETESGEWKLTGARPDEQLDPAKTAAVSSPLSSPSFTDVRPGNQLIGDGTNAPTVLKIETFDDLGYTVTVGAKTNEDYFLTVAVTGQTAKQRTPGPDEKPEDKAKLDKEFNDRRQKLEEKLKHEQSCGKWTYVVAGWGIDPLLKKRSELLADKKEEPKEDGTSNTLRNVMEPTITNPLPAVRPNP